MQQQFLDAAGLPVRLLHRRHDDDGGHLRRRAEGGPAPGPQGQPVPLHRLPGHRGRRLRAARATRIRQARVDRRGRRRSRGPGSWATTSRPRPAGPSSPAGPLHPGRPGDELPGLLHMKLLAPRTPTPAYCQSTRTPRWRFPAWAVFTHLDAPAQLFSTAQHELFKDDPDDSRVLDHVVRFKGQRVAAVVADTVAAAEAGVRALEVEYEVLDAVFTPLEAIAPAPRRSTRTRTPPRPHRPAGAQRRGRAPLRDGQCGAGLRRRRTSSTANLPHPARAARRAGNPRRHRW